MSCGTVAVRNLHECALAAVCVDASDEDEGSSGCVDDFGFGGEASQFFEHPCCHCVCGDIVDQSSVLPQCGHWDNFHVVGLWQNKVFGDERPIVA